jgi:hypothetical protein
MFRIEASCDIHAPIDIVWLLLTDLSSYKEWCSGVTFAEGAKLTLGGKATVRTTAPDGSGKIFQTEVRFTQLLHCREFAWKGGFWPILTGEHYWQLQTIDPVKTRLTQGESFGGLYPVFKRGTMKTFQPFYEQLSLDLKKAAETRFRR